MMISPNWGETLRLTGCTTTTSTNISSLSTSSSYSLTNGTLVNGHQVDSVDLQAFESFHQGRALNDNQLFIVIYLIDTFRYEITTSNADTNGNNNNNGCIDEKMDSYVKKAIFRAYMDLIKDLPDKISIRVNIQVNKNVDVFSFSINRIDTLSKQIKLRRNS